MRGRPISFLVYALSMLLLLIACNNNIYIATDSYDMTFVAAHYNNSFRNKSLVVYYNEKIQLAVDNNKVDFVISHKDFFEHNANIISNNLFNKVYVPTRETILLLPHAYQLLSFSLPLIVVHTQDDQIQNLHQSRITLSQLAQLSKDTTVIDDSEDMVTLGFYPIQDGFENVFDTLGDYKIWLEKANIHSRQASEYFRFHYGIAPITARLKDRNILYKYMSSYEFFTLPYEVRKDFTPYLLTLDDGDFVAINALFLAKYNITKLNNSKFNSFTNWLYSLETQLAIIKMKKSYLQVPEVTFLDNQLSANWDTNDTLLFRNNNWLWESQPLLTQIIIP